MKHTRKLLALLVTLLLVLSAVPVASADEEYVTEAWLSKTYNAEVFKKLTFEFQAVEGENNPQKSVELTFGEQQNKVSFAESDLEDGTGTKYLKLNFPIGTVTADGCYEYTVTEKELTGVSFDGEHEKMLMSKAEYKVQVYVTTEGDEHVIKNIVVYRMKNDDGDSAGESGGVKVEDVGEGSENGFNFENTYVYEAGIGDDPTDPDDGYDTNGALLVSKTVMNNNQPAAEDETAFQFTAQITLPAGVEASDLEVVTSGVEGVTGDVASGYTFSLKHGESLKFTGLPVGTTINLTETGTPNYKGSASVTIGTDTAVGSNATNYGDNLVVKAFDLGKDASNTASVTNTYNYVPQTGIILNVLPFAVMLALAGGALALFLVLKRRNADEEA